MAHINRYFYTIARRDGVSHIAIGLFLISNGKVLVIYKDGCYSIPKIDIEDNKTIDQAIDVLAREHGIENFEVEMWIDRIKETIDEKKIHRLNFAISGKIKRTKKHAWVSQDDLPKDMQKTFERYLEKRFKDCP